MSKKYRIYLFNEDNPEGKIFKLSEKEIESYKQDGWKDSPESFSPESFQFPEETGVGKEQAGAGKPELLLFDDDEIAAEANRRGLKLTDFTGEEIAFLIDRFKKDPKSLKKDELLNLGCRYSLGLRLNFKNEAMIDKISEAIAREA
jgi:hypothetical protein